MKRILSIFIMILSLSFAFSLAACDKSDPLSGVTFSDATFEYDGQVKSIAVANLPEGYTVEYEFNNQTEPGTYKVIAKIKDSSGSVAKSMVAKLIIVAPAEPTTPAEPTKPAACEHVYEYGSNGTHHWQKCSKCGEETDAVAHSGGEATETEQAKCEVCGRSYGELKDPEGTPTPTLPEHEHSYETKYDANQHWTECSCGDATAKENHKGGEATETEQAKCEVCNQPYGELKDPTPVVPTPEGDVYTVEVNGTSYPLTENVGTDKTDGRLAEYMAEGLSVTEGDQIVIKLNGEAVTNNIGPDLGDNNIGEDFKVRTTATANIYFKVYPTGHSVWLTGYQAPQGGDDPITPDPDGNTIKIYLDINWENITEAWCNDKQMTASTDGNGIYVIEISAASLSSFKLDFKQDSSWWHITYQNPSDADKWNTAYMLPYEMVAGKVYKVTNVNWSHQYDNQENKWYTCTIVEVE